MKNRFGMTIKTFVTKKKKRRANKMFRVRISNGDFNGDGKIRG